MALQDIKMSVPARDPTITAAPPVHVAVGNIVPDGGGGVIDPRRSGHDVDSAILILDEQDDRLSVSGDDFTHQEDDFTDHSSEDDFSDYSSEDDFSYYFSEEEDSDSYNEDVDSDSEFEEDDQPPPDTGHDTTDAPGVILMRTSLFLGRPTPAACVHNITGFMRLAAAGAAPGMDGGEILVHYQYTRFTRAQIGGDDVVDMHVSGPKLASFRFHVPSHAVAADPASSLRLAGASLTSLFYPTRFAVQLRALWSGMVMVAASSRVPPWATRLVVTVDVGILRPGDHTPERMRSVCAALESVACERDARRRPTATDISMELHLPAPLASEDDVRPMKRRSVTGEDCPICCEALKRDLAAWPRCSHIFHGRCLEEHLVRGYEVCPLCRTELKVHA